jgi:hypothetical protein
VGTVLECYMSLIEETSASDITKQHNTVT